MIKRELDHKAILAKQYNEGKAEGIAEGKAEGLVEGEVKNKVETAKMMLEEGLDLKLISKLTKLSITEINNLLK